MKARIVSIHCSRLLLLAAALALLPFFSFRVNASFCATHSFREAPACAVTAPAKCLPCKGPPIREALASSDAVFIGNAIEGDEEKEKIISDGKKIVLLSGRVRFSVEWVFNGVKRSEVIVRTLDDYCLGFGPFTKAERYLLYAQGNEDDGFSVLFCTRSTPIAAADEDLKILSSLSSKTCGVRLYGMVGHISGVRVTATDSRGKTLKAVTEVGHFEINGVRSNVEYTVEAYLPDYFQKNHITSTGVRINPCGWKKVHFSAAYDSSISGRVTGPDGAPVNKAVVELMSSNSISVWNDKSAISDSQGRFEFSGVAPGAYMLGVNVTEEPDKNRPYPPTWYPKATTRQSGTSIILGSGQKLSGYDIIISRSLTERTIEGTVYWPDGSPAEKADVYLSPATLPGSGARKSIYTDSQGRFKVTGYEDIDYYLVASSAPNRDEPPVRKWFFAEPPLVEVKEKNVTGINLTLTWDEATLEDFFKQKRKR